MRVLIVTESAKDQAQAVKDYAEKHLITYEQMRRLAEGLDPELAPGRDPERQMELDFGYKVVYSVEQHRHPSHRQPPLKHLSISVAGAGLPATEAVNAVLGLFEMSRAGSPGQRAWIETLSDGGQALNIIEPRINGHDPVRN